MPNTEIPYLLVRCGDSPTYRMMSCPAQSDILLTPFLHEYADETVLGFQIEDLNYSPLSAEIRLTDVGVICLKEAISVYEKKVRRVREKIMPDSVVVLIIDHKHGTNLYVCENRKVADQECYKFVQEYWTEAVPDEPMPDDPEEAIDMFFCDNEEFFMEIEAHDIVREEK